MKKNVLKNLALMTMLLVSCNSLFSQYAISEVVWRYDDENGAEILENDDVVLGSTIHYTITYSSPVDTKINPMQRTYYRDGFSGNAWPNIGAITVTAGTDVVVTGTREVLNTPGIKTTAEMIDNEKGILKLALVNPSGANTFWQQDINYIAASTNPDQPILSAASYTNQGTIALGSSIDFDVDFSVPDNGKVYELAVMQSNVLEGGSAAVWVNTSKYVIAATDASLSETYNVVTENHEGTLCVAGDGNISFVLFEDANIIADTRIQIQTAFTNTSTRVTANTDMKVKVYPNPATDIVNIEAEEGSLIEILNVAGSLLKSELTSFTKHQVSLADLAPGMYVITISKDGKVNSSKLMIK